MQTQPLAGWREHVGQGNGSALDRTSEDFGVDAIGLALVLADTKLTNASGVDHQGLVSPFTQDLVHVPAFPTRLEGDSSG